MRRETLRGIGVKLKLLYQEINRWHGNDNCPVAAFGVARYVVNGAAAGVSTGTAGRIHNRIRAGFILPTC